MFLCSRKVSSPLMENVCFFYPSVKGYIKMYGVNQDFLNFLEMKGKGSKEVLFLFALLKQCKRENENPFSAGDFVICGLELHIPEILQQEDLDEKFFPIMMEIAQGTTLSEYVGELSSEEFSLLKEFQTFCFDFLF